MRYAMRYRILLLATVLASGLAGAETIAVDSGIAVKQSDVSTPTRGMTMDQVSGKFGAPASKVPAVGKPRSRAGSIRGSSCISSTSMSFTASLSALKS
jgi:hypothetical protein